MRWPFFLSPPRWIRWIPISSPTGRDDYRKGKISLRMRGCPRRKEARVLPLPMRLRERSDLLRWWDCKASLFLRMQRQAFGKPIGQPSEPHRGTEGKTAITRTKSSEEERGYVPLQKHFRSHADIWRLLRMQGDLPLISESGGKARFMGIWIKSQTASMLAKNDIRQLDPSTLMV